MDAGRGAFHDDRDTGHNQITIHRNSAQHKLHKHGAYLRQCRTNKIIILELYTAMGFPFRYSIGGGGNLHVNGPSNDGDKIELTIGGGLRG